MKNYFHQNMLRNFFLPKTCLIFYLLILAPSFAVSEDAPQGPLEEASVNVMKKDIFLGESSWNGESEFLPLDGSGVEYLAFKAAWDECRDDKVLLWGVERVNRQLCVFKASYSQFFNLYEKVEDSGEYRYRTSFKALVQSIDRLEGSIYLKKSPKLFQAEGNWRSHRKFSNLKEYGIKMDALKKAILECEEAGYHWCVVEELPSFILRQHKYVDQDPKSGYYGDTRYKTSAKAQVRGYYFGPN